MIEQQAYDISTPEGRRHANRVFEFKIMARQKMNKNCLAAIWDFLDEQGIQLPQYKSQYKERKAQLLQYQTHDGETESMEDAFGRLINMYYTIKDSGYSLGAAFMDRNGAVETQTVVHACSRSKLDQVWILRKEQIVRRTYRTWLAKGMAEGWLYNYTPVHIVLTVPHANGLYKGKRFYGDEILSDFNLIRKNPLWLAMVHGGEYGLETKRGRDGNGLHIHVHSFTLLNSHYDYTKFSKASKDDLVFLLWWADSRKKERVFESETDAHEFFADHKRGDLLPMAIEAYRGRTVTLPEFQSVLYRLWERQTGGFKIWVERLYRFRKHQPEPGQKSSKWVTEYVKPRNWDTRSWETEVNVGHPFPELKLQRKKFYIDQDSPLEDWTAGILECIKYHFKGDTFYNSKTKEWDVLLMMEVLNNTVNKRFYGRFGAFYRTPELSFNFGNEDHAAEVLPQPDQKVMWRLMGLFRVELIERIMDLSKSADINRLNRANKKRLCEILAALEAAQTDAEETAQAITADADTLAGYSYDELLALLRHYRPGFQPKEDITTPADLARMIAEHHAQKVATGMDFDEPAPVHEVVDENPRARRVLENLLNPFTLQVPEPEEWNYCIFHPADRAHRSRYALDNNHASLERDLGKFLFLSKKMSLKSIIRAMMTNRLGEVRQKDQVAAESAALTEKLRQLDGELNRHGYYSDYVFGWRPVNLEWEKYDRLSPVEKMRHMADARIKYLNEKGVGVKELKNGDLSFSADGLFSSTVSVKETPMYPLPPGTRLPDAPKTLPPADPNDLPF